MPFPLAPVMNLACPHPQVRLMPPERKSELMARADGSTSRCTEIIQRRDMEMFTARELEALLKIDVKTIYRYAERGLIPYVRIQSNVRFPKRQILEWIERQSYRPWPPSANAERRH